MAKVRYNKNSLTQQRQKLRLYERLLPSLDLRRRQLAVGVDRERREQARVEAAARELDERIGEELPMLANPKMSVGGLVRVTGVEMDEENYVGARLPVLEKIEFAVAPYSLLAKPAWIDVLVRRLQDAVELRMRVRVVARRLEILEHAMRRTTQRLNLFERILIPTTVKTIQRIQIFLGDLERDAVVRSKIAKAKQRQRIETVRAAEGGP